MQQKNNRHSHNQSSPLVGADRSWLQTSYKKLSAASHNVRTSTGFGAESGRFSQQSQDCSVQQKDAWRCTRCDKLLGVSRDGRMHLRFARAHEYFVCFPVQATCRGCGTLNQASNPAR